MFNDFFKKDYKTKDLGTNECCFGHSKEVKGQFKPNLKEIVK